MVISAVEGKAGIVVTATKSPIDVMVGKCGHFKFYFLIERVKSGHYPG